MRPNKTNFGLSFGDFGEQNVKERKEEEKKKKKKKKKRKGMELGFCMETTFVWILVLDAMMILYGILWELYGILWELYG